MNHAIFVLVTALEENHKKTEPGFTGERDGKTVFGDIYTLYFEAYTSLGKLNNVNV